MLFCIGFMMGEDKTIVAYKRVIVACKKLFADKTHDYGASWRILRLPSITDQVFIKAQRIRNIQETRLQKVADNVEDEFVGIINYCTMALIQLHLGSTTQIAATFDRLEPEYDRAVDETLALLQNKNHDYGEAWREMRVSSITDIILMKVLRVKQIENNAGKTQVSEGVKANYQDILNYAVFALLKLKGISNS